MAALRSSLRMLDGKEPASGTPEAKAKETEMKTCPVCGWRYDGTYSECPFCKEDELAEQELRRRNERRKRRTPKFSRQFRLVAGAQIILLVVMASALQYLLRNPVRTADSGESKPAPVIAATESGTKAPEVSPPAQDEAETGTDQPAAPADPGESAAPSEGSTSTTPAEQKPPANASGADDGLKAGSAEVMGAENGVRVRSGPGTSYNVLASVYNGAPIQVIKPAGDDWYEITFLNGRGVRTSGYMKGEFLKNV